MINEGFTPFPTFPQIHKVVFGWSWRRDEPPPPLIVVLSVGKDLPILGRGKDPFPTNPKTTFLLCHAERSEASPPFMFSRGSLEGDPLTPSIELETPHCVRGDTFWKGGFPLSNFPPKP